MILSGNRLSAKSATDLNIPSSHNVPERPGGQLHETSLMRSVHWPPFIQGFDVHSSMSVSHRSPVKPSTHSQLKYEHGNCINLLQYGATNHVSCV